MSAYMFNIRGFASISALADNEINVVAPLGELSTNAQTYSREKGHYTEPTLGEVVFVSFDCRDENNDLQPLPMEYQDSTLTVTNWLYNQARLGQVPTEATALIQNIYNEFGVDVVEDVQLGTLINVGSIRLPSWISWSLVGEGDGNRIKVWFSNQAFVTEYDQYEINVIPPVDEIDALFGPYENVANLVADRTTGELMDLIAIARGSDPYTYLKTLTYNRVSITTPNVIPTNWTVMIYGIAGNNPDTIKQAIIDHIMANTERTYEEWKALLPELFTNTEFIITPFWNNIAIPNETEAAGLYSPIVSIDDILDYAMLTKGAYSESHVNYAARSLQTTYKSIPVVAVGGEENLNGQNIIDMVFPDYISVNPASIDANRMSPKTLEWSYQLHAMIKEAEVMTPFSDVPPTFSRLWRDDVLFTTSSLDGIQYLVATKWYVASNVTEEE